MTPQTRDFSPLRCIGTSFGYLVATRRDLLMIATPPVIALALIGTLTTLVVPEAAITMGDPMQGVPPSVPLAFLMLLVLQILFYVMFAVAWHRKYLVPGEAVTVAEALKWRREKTRFLLLLIGIVLLMFLAVFLLSPLVAIATAVLGPAGFAAIGLVYVLGLIVFARLSLALPAAAIGRKEFGLRAAWAATRRRSAAMFFILVLPVLIGLVGAMPVNLLAGVFGAVGLLETATGIALLALLNEAIRYVAIALGVSTLSAAYLELADGHGAPPQS
ncbi:MAG: hypothetical protein NXI21_17795 [Alphaproteobacteria bacterium]|nr:hypothetical protein [Alphaproteobacteria bacterium]